MLNHRAFLAICIDDDNIFCGYTDDIDINFVACSAGHLTLFFADVLYRRNHNSPERLFGWIMSILFAAIRYYYMQLSCSNLVLVTAVFCW